MRTDVRPATSADLPAIAALHVTSWKETYEGLLPESCLASLSSDARLEKWQKGFEFVADGRDGLLIATDAEEILGFVSVGPAREEAYEAFGEIYAIYCLKSIWKQGVGFALFRSAVDWLQKRGYKDAYLWVLDRNVNALKSYERWGGTPEPDCLKHDVIDGEAVKEIRVVFQNINSRL